MSSNSVIKVENLSKCYQIYQKPHDRLKQSLVPRLRKILGIKNSKNYFHEFWALRKFSVEIKKGETIGIIGRNGSGKSTLLQLICGTLNPSGGEIAINGRVAALLELGSGFNPEFTGRENVYLNAMILGLSKEQIDERYLAIEKFADIGDFIDQPVKTYSSGMTVRLAFAVIAHVDADILVVDEALAVGDAIFVQKCMRFIRKFKKNGTLLFVSHDASSIMNLCDRAIWMDHGEIRRQGNAKTVSEEYLKYTLQEVYGDEAQLANVSPQSDEFTTTESAASDYLPMVQYGGLFEVSNNLSESSGWKTGAAEILSIQILDLKDHHANVLKGGEVVRVVIRAAINQYMRQPILGFVVRDRLGQDLFGENTLPYTDQNPSPTQAGQIIQGEFIFRLPMLPNGNYSVMCSIADGDLYDHIQHHWLNEGLIFTVASSKIRWGIVGVEIQDISLINIT